MLSTEGHKFTIAAVQCAEKVAPYIHARLLAVESRRDMTQDKAPYVVRVPAVLADSTAWQTAVGALRASIKNACDSSRLSVIKRDRKGASGVVVHQDYCAVWLRNAASAFGDNFPPKSLTHSNDAELEFQSRRAYPAVK
jgi:hypothetical protein